MERPNPRRSVEVPSDPPPLRGPAAVLFRALLPHAERSEVMGELAAEYADRLAARGPLAARAWLWRQLLGSIPALARRSWWRGWTGFEPSANRLQPGGFVVESWIMDVRYSARRLASRPTYTILAVLTLALGAAGTAAVSSVARALLLDPLPVAREADVGVLWFSGSWTEQEFLHLRPDFPGFARMAAYRPLDATLEQPGQPLRLVRGIGTSAELFDVLGAGPMLGRTFRAGDDRPGAAPAVVLGHSLWQDLGADPGLIGRPLRLGGVARTVVGVMPPGFWFPTPETRLWTAMPLTDQNRSGWYTLVGRIAPSASMEHMEGPLGALASRLDRRFDYPLQWDKTRSPSITPLRETLVGDVRPGVLATLAAVGLILLIACVNVSALMLAQVAGRTTELAVRGALGAGRQRLIQQILAESLLVGLMAGVLGALLAAGGFGILVQSLPLGALGETAALDWRVFSAAILAALAAAGAIALVPGTVLWRGNLQASLATMRSGGVSARGVRLEGALVVAQVGLAVLLAVGAALLIRSLANLRAIDPGFAARDAVVIDATMPAELPDEARLRSVLELLPSLQGLPGVRAAAATQKLPLRGSGDNWGIAVQGRPDLEASTTAFRIVTHDYFQALGARVLRGRGFLPTDRATTERVVVINQALAAKYFPGEDPLGRILLTGFDDRGERVVGVVANIAESDLTDAPEPARYMLYDQVPMLSPGVSFVLAAASPDGMAPLFQAGRRAIERGSRQFAVEQVTTLEAVFDAAVGPAGRLAGLLSLLAGLALVLGAVGVYGMISHDVARRARDFGIRIALGLPPARVVSHVLRRGMGLVAAGSLAGLAAAFLMMRLLSSLLYGVRASDPVALAGGVAALLVAGTVAALIPARRASRTDPLTVLRQQ